MKKYDAWNLLHLRAHEAIKMLQENYEKVFVENKSDDFPLRMPGDLKALDKMVKMIRMFIDMNGHELGELENAYWIANGHPLAKVEE